MSGLTNPVRAYPFGYNNPKEKPAVEHLPSALAPSEYNKGTLPKAPGLRRNVPIANPGMQQPPVRKIDVWGNINARTILPAPVTDFHIDRLPQRPGALTSPPTEPWSKEFARKKMAALTGISEESTPGAPSRDILQVARVFMETTTDPAIKNVWEMLLNSLAQLDAIALSRDLTSQESKTKDDIRKRITQMVQDAPLAIDMPPVDKKEAPSAFDIGEEVAKQLAVLMKSQPKMPSSPPDSLGASPPDSPTVSIKMPKLESKTPSPKAKKSESPSPKVKAQILPPGSPAQIPLEGEKPIIRKDIGPSTVGNAAIPGTILVEIDMKEDRGMLQAMLTKKYGATINYAMAREAFEKVVSILSSGKGKKAKKAELARYDDNQFTNWIIWAFSQYPQQSKILQKYLTEGTNLDDFTKYPYKDLYECATQSVAQQFFRNPGYVALDV